MSKFEIHIGDAGEVREATEAEDEVLQEHLDETPKCQGRKIRDDGVNTTLGGRPRLRCTACGVGMTVRVRLF
jgi:hypothetical protein